MNCLEARGLLLSNPLAEDAALLAHLQGCDGCHAFSVELSQQENQLREALDVPVPKQLAERILLNTQLRKPRWQRPVLAAAAVLFVLVGVGGYLLPSAPMPAAWSEVVLAHVLNERDTLQGRAQISADQLRLALAGFGLTVSDDLGRIDYLDRCEMPGGKGLHVVINTVELGQVTLILPPPGTPAQGGQSSRDGFTSTLVQVGRTSIGVVTAHPDRARRLNHWLEEKLRPT